MEPFGENSTIQNLRLQVPEYVISRKVGDETVILNLESSIYFGLDPVGGRFLELLEAGEPVSAIVSTMLDEFDVARIQLEADLSRLIAEMKAGGLLFAA